MDVKLSNLMSVERCRFILAGMKIWYKSDIK